MMATFYLVNHRNRRMQQYSWKVISSTISIFSAVLLFQGVNGVVEYVVSMEDHSLLQQFYIDILQMFCWFGILQLMLGYFSGAFGEHWHKPKTLSEMQTNMKTFAVLLGHITGFSAINAWGTLQQIMFYDVTTGGEGIKDSGHVGLHGSTLRAALVIPIAYVAMSVVYTLTEGVRMKVSKQDNDISEYEMYWMTETEDTENDVTGLTISFLIVQVLRLVIGGYLPNQEGEELEKVKHSYWQSFTLVSLSVLFAFIKGKIPPIQGFHRTHSVTMLVIAMSVAWCFLFSTSWTVLRATDFEEHEAIESVVLALISTCVSFLIILLALEAIELRYKGHPPEIVERSVHAVLESLGILVGFSWERSFDSAIKIISEEVTIMPEAVTKLCLAIALFTLVGPAWRLYILPIVLTLDEEERLEQEEVALKSLYGKLMAGTIEATHHMVQAPLEYLLSKSEGQEAEDMQEKARERLEVMEQKMKIETLTKEHSRLSEQSIIVATRLFHLGHADVLKRTKEEKQEVARASELRRAMIDMEAVDKERQREIAKLNQRIQELEVFSGTEADRMREMGDMQAKIADSEMRAQKAESESVRTLDSLATVTKEVAALRVDIAAKDVEIEKLLLQGSHSFGVEVEEREEAQVTLLQAEVAARMEEVEALRNQLQHNGASSEAAASEVPSVTLTSRNASGNTLPSPWQNNSRAGRVVGGLHHLVQEGEAQAAALLHTIGAGIAHGHTQPSAFAAKAASQVPRVALQQVPKSPAPTSPISPISPSSLPTRTRMTSAPAPWVPTATTAGQKPPQEPLQVKPPQEPLQVTRRSGQEPLPTNPMNRSPRVVMRSNPSSTATSPVQVIAGQPPPLSPSASQGKPQGGVAQQSAYLRGSQAPWVQQVANNSLQTPLLR